MNIQSANFNFGLKMSTSALSPAHYSTNPQLSFGRKKLTKDIFVNSRLDTRPVPELQQQAENTQNSITRDGFTGLRDKRCLLDRLSEKIEEAKENGKNIGLAMFDMDNFKSINELLGYETGDEFIKHIGTSVQEVAREHSLGSYRFGGEEFIIIFKDRGTDEMEEVCSEVQKKINSNDVFGKYSTKYVQNAKKLLEKYNEENMYLEEIKKLKIQKELLNSLIEESPEFFHNDAIKSRLEGIDSSLRSYYSGLLTHSIKKEQNSSTRKKLEDYKHGIKMSSNESTRESIFNDDFLNNYMALNFDKSAQIAQIKLWLNEHNKNNGFTITCGIVDTPAEKLDNVNAKDLIDEVGEVLKEGKHAKKGGMYLQSNN